MHILLQHYLGLRHTFVLQASIIGKEECEYIDFYVSSMRPKLRWKQTMIVQPQGELELVCGINFFQEYDDTVMLSCQSTKVGIPSTGFQLSWHGDNSVFVLSTPLFNLNWIYVHPVLMLNRGQVTQFFLSITWIFTKIQNLLYYAYDLPCRWCEFIKRWAGLRRGGPADRDGQTDYVDGTPTACGNNR